MPSRPKTKRKRLLKGCLLLFGALVLGAGVTVGFLVYRVIMGPAGMAEGASKAYRAAGMPWEAKDLGQGPVAPERNAAILFQETGKQLAKLHPDQDATSIRKLIEVGSFGAAAKQLSSYAAALDILDTASSRPEIVYDWDWDLGMALQMPELTDTKRYVRLVCLEAQLDAANHAPDKTIRDLAIAWRLSILIGREPGMLAMLSQVGCENIVLDACQRCAATMKDDVASLAEIESITNVPNALPNFGRALRGEAYFILAGIRNPSVIEKAMESSGKADPTQGIDRATLVRSGLPRDIKDRALAALFFQIWTDVKAAIDSYPDDPQGLGAATVRISDKWSKKSLMGQIGVVALPAFSQAGKAVAELKATRAVTFALIEAMRLKARIGRWPTRAEDIPGKWIDPFTGDPLKIKETPESFRVYSVGPNLHDDGGIRKSEILGDLSKANYDIVASYPPRKYGQQGLAKSR